jgi:STE24 endopeptidase
LIVWVIGRVGALIAIPLHVLEVPWWTAVLVQGLAFGLPGFAISLPFRYLGSYRLPRHFGMLTQPLREWMLDLAKETVVLAGMGLPTILGLYAILRYGADRWWLWAAVAYTLCVIAFTAVLPVVLLPIFYRIRPLGPEHIALAERLTALAQRAKTRVRGVFSLEMSRRTPAANALLLGLGKTRRILLTDTLLTNFTPDEIETVIGHEMAHHVYRDIPVGIAVHALLSLAAFRIADFVYRAVVVGTVVKTLDDAAGLPLLLMVLALAFFVTSPIANAYSRWREARADTFALRLTRKPEAFASAMTRFANLNLAVVNPSRLTSGMTSHPTLISRIRKAEIFAARLRAEAQGRESAQPGAPTEQA